MTLQAAMTINVQSALRGTSGLASVVAGLDHSLSKTFADGTDANQANRAWSALELSVPAGGSYDIDLQNLTDALGLALSFARIKAILIQNTDAAIAISAGPHPTTNAWTGWLGPGSSVAVRAGG